MADKPEIAAVILDMIDEVKATVDHLKAQRTGVEERIQAEEKFLALLRKKLSAVGGIELEEQEPPHAD